jgi:hypothetical protein
LLELLFFYEAGPDRLTYLSRRSRGQKQST